MASTLPVAALHPAALCTAAQVVCCCYHVPDAPYGCVTKQPYRPCNPGFRLPLGTRSPSAPVAIPNHPSSPESHDRLCSSCTLTLGETQRCFTQAEPWPVSLALGKVQATDGLSPTGIADHRQAPGAGLRQFAFPWLGDTWSLAGALAPLRSLFPSCLPVEGAWPANTLVAVAASFLGLKPGPPCRGSGSISSTKTKKWGHSKSIRPQAALWTLAAAFNSPGSREG